MRPIRCAVGDAVPQWRRVLALQRMALAQAFRPSPDVRPRSLLEHIPETGKAHGSWPLPQAAVERFAPTAEQIPLLLLSDTGYCYPYPYGGIFRCICWAPKEGIAPKTARIGANRATDTSAPGALYGADGCARNHPVEH